MKSIINLIVLLGIPAMLNAQSIVTTKHNLSVSGTGSVIATSETEVCIFCHITHKSNPNLKPLWNRPTPTSTYTVYGSNGSTTMKASPMPGQPTGSSILCLSCHDGTVALGNVLSKLAPITFASTVNMPAGPSNLGLDLTNDHPISFNYDATLATAKLGELKNPASLPSQIKLHNSKMECTSCHDAHVNIYSKFLVVDPKNSNLCNSCHQENNWAASSHNTSTKTWNGVAPNPWPYTPYTKVSENGCENCHNPHNGGATKRLLKYQTEEDNCLDCHNGNAASKNISAEFAKTSKHGSMYLFTGVHDPLETPAVTSKHVECIDCHSSHSAKAQTTTPTAPDVKNPNIGVIGIDKNGSTINPVNYEYEICFKCHSSTAAVATAISSPRKVVQSDIRLEVDQTTSISYHPISAAGKNVGIAGLISYTAASFIYCTDCHSNNNLAVGSPAGPHGSDYPKLLKYSYDTAYTYDSITPLAKYDLCYKCHDITVTEDNHKKIGIGTGIALGHTAVTSHGKLTTCNNCHDPHGVNGSSGTLANNRYLINFNTNIVTSNGGLLNWTYGGSREHGSCVLSCHGKAHDATNATY